MGTVQKTVTEKETATDLKSRLDKYKKRNRIQYTVDDFGRRIFASPVEARMFADTLDERVTDPKFLPFYCNAIRRLGRDKVACAQSMALAPGVKNPERMFSWLLKNELEAVK